MGILADIVENADRAIMKRDAMDRLDKLADSLENSLREFRSKHDDRECHKWLASINVYYEDENAGDVYPLDNNMAQALIERIRK